MFTTLYKKCLDLAAHRSSKYYLAAVSFIESSFFPIPPDILLIPLSIGNRDKAISFAIICSLCSIFGGVIGYFIGYSIWWTEAGEFTAFAQFFTH